MIRHFFDGIVALTDKTGFKDPSSLRKCWKLLPAHVSNGETLKIALFTKCMSTVFSICYVRIKDVLQQQFNAVHHKSAFFPSRCTSVRAGG